MFTLYDKDEHWDLSSAEKEARGYDREAYEYELNLQQKKAALPNLVHAVEDSGITYLVELTGPLDTPEKVQRAAEMEFVPEVVHGSTAEDGRAVVLACINGGAKGGILKACDLSQFEQFDLMWSQALEIV